MPLGFIFGSFLSKIGYKSTKSSPKTLRKALGGGLRDMWAPGTKKKENGDSLYAPGLPKWSPKSVRNRCQILYFSHLFWHRFRTDFGLHFGSPGAYNESPFSFFFVPGAHMSRRPPPRAPRSVFGEDLVDL
jgi:hypothetical protein